jgi:hypothetical protein
MMSSLVKVFHEMKEVQLKKNILFAVLFLCVFSLNSNSVLALNASAMTVVAPSVLYSSGNFSIIANYKDGSGFKIDNATVDICYSYEGNSSCFLMTEEVSDYAFMFEYDGTNGGLLAFNVSGSMAGYDDASKNFTIEMTTSNYTVRFWQDYTMMNAFINENLWVYAVPSCSGLNGTDFDACNATAFHSPYVNGTATLKLYAGTFSLWVVDGNVIWGGDLSQPVISSYISLVSFDDITLLNNQAGYGNYLWDATGGLGFGLNWAFWSSVIGLILLIAGVCLVAYATKDSNASWIVVIITFLVIYILLKYFGVLTGAIFWIF